MKTHTMKTTTSKLLIVELPKEQKVAFGYYSDQLTIFDPEKDFRDSEINFDGNWELLGRPDEIREEDVVELVQCINVGTTNRYIASVQFFNTVSERYYETAKESLLSLIETDIHWDVNPLGNRNPANDPDFPYLADAQQSRIKEWQEAEQKTFIRNRTLIFKKNK